ncbi:MAG: MarR family transcriptional regulator [Acidobacteriota bacterium]|nr:MarR family transcriptional regulator [Acidobacteriota bacterium]
MSIYPSKQKRANEALGVAEQLRTLLSRWVRTAREQAGTPSSARVETLRLLEDGGPATIAALAQGRAVKHQSMRLVVEQLATSEAVEKRTDPMDGRKQMVRITSKGRAVLKQEQRIRARWIAQLLKECSSRELDQVVTALAALQMLLDKAANVDAS